MSSLKYFETKKARIEIIPMIDIMFFLLVFFIMITLHMIPVSGVSSNLSKSTTASDLNHPNVIVSVNAAGEIIVDDKHLDMEQLDKLIESKGDPAKTVVTIAATKDTSMQTFMKIMDACREAGVTQVGLAAQKI